jgi:DNA repair exonuclease SbcCD nuclease subunit
VIIDATDIEKSGLDYIALGHWHSFQDFSQGATAACYAGSPEPIDMDQKGAGNVVMIALQEKGKVDFQPVRV